MQASILTGINENGEKITKEDLLKKVKLFLDNNKDFDNDLILRLILISY